MSSNMQSVLRRALAQTSPDGDTTLRLHPHQWGPHLWGIMELTAQLYPWVPSETDKKLAYERYKANGTFIQLSVCGICTNHYNSFVYKKPPALANREALVRWVLEAHNKVNIQNGKRTWTYEEVNASFWGPQWKDIFAMQQAMEGFNPATKQPFQQNLVTAWFRRNAPILATVVLILVLVALVAYIIYTQKK